MNSRKTVVSRKQGQQVKFPQVETESGQAKKSQVKSVNKVNRLPKAAPKTSVVNSSAQQGILINLGDTTSLDKALPNTLVKKKKVQIEKSISTITPAPLKNKNPSARDIAQDNLRALEDAATPKPLKISKQCVPPLFFKIAVAIATLSSSKLSFAVAGLYVALCNLLSRFLVVQVAYPYGSYGVEVNVSGLIVGEPSTNKSPVIRKILEQAHELIHETKQQDSGRTLFDIEKERIQRKEARKKIELAQKIQAEDPKQAKNLEAEARSLLTKSDITMHHKNFIISKSSLAALVSKVSKTDDPLLMVHEEAGALLKLTQKAGDPTKEFYIGLMDGDSTENYENAHHEFNTRGKRLSILGAVQPDAISKIVISVNDGLIQRFPIIAYADTASERKIALKISQVKESFEIWKNILTGLMKHPEKRFEVKLSVAAQQQFCLLKNQFNTRINDRQTNPILKGLLGKRCSFIVSIAAANAFIRNGGFENLTIMGEDIKFAAAYAKLNEEHFKIAFNFNEENQEKRALELLNRIMCSKFEKEEFTASQIAKNEWRNFKESSSVENLLNILKEYQLADKVKPTVMNTGGRPTVHWKINTDLLEN